ncbi:ornithine carbamoyltransferase [Heyndrickxia acidicola]|uniref:Ornithine carbamoyltransferase n=1 Tax=Heyndrickxia acidicola TaxID=209389 RepID=A0ABU6MLW8_9BACI|nr:ornithine carbamoyltransferase [Heyndrickxia acidicola]MED1204045.1 ornithine carbamoyltransferase [Heyndrickxia acidicola]
MEQIALDIKGIPSKILANKDFLTIGELTSLEIRSLLQKAIELKTLHKEGRGQPLLKGKILGMIFEKSSTRTRVSFEAGMLQLGGQALFLSSKDIQLGRGETIHDTAKVLSRYVDGLMIRTFGHGMIEEFAEHASVPVINGLTDLHHPAQVLADLLTIYEKKGRLKGLKLCYIGDGNNNMCHSLMEGAVKMGMHISVAFPKGYEPNRGIAERVLLAAKKAKITAELTSDPITAIKNADVVVTDVWTSMGFERENEQRLVDFEGFQVNNELCKYANKDFIFLHCLPAHRGEEVAGEVIDGSHSVVFDEAENRLHAQKAILADLLG